MEATIALAVFIGLPLLVLVVVARFRPGRRARRGPGDLAERLAEVEQVVIYQDARLAQVEGRIAALEQAQAPLYQVQ